MGDTDVVRHAALGRSLRFASAGWPVGLPRWEYATLDSGLAGGFQLRASELVTAGPAVGTLSPVHLRSVELTDRSDATPLSCVGCHNLGRIRDL